MKSQNTLHGDHSFATKSSARVVGLLAAFAGVLVLCTAVPTAEARPRPSASSFSANKTFGLGLMLGVPTGLSGKYYLSGDTAVDFGLGVISRYGDRDGLHLHADFLWHPAVLASTAPFELPFYFGVGGRLWDYDRNNNNNRDDDIALGVRVPVGIMMDFNNVPIDIFFELAFVLDFLLNDGGAEAQFNGAIGIRYYFM